MMKMISTGIAVGFTMLMSTSALANIEAIDEMADGVAVSAEGIVDDVNNEREFVLRDSSGTINVDIESGQSVVLRKGDTVSVSGVVDKDVTGTDINATDVQVHKDTAEILKDAIEGHTDISLQGATAYTIRDLPGSGTVKVQGTVTDVDDEKEFTLEDGTGTIEVELTSTESAAITDGAEVTVIGQINAARDKIEASRVMVLNSAQPRADNN